MDQWIDICMYLCIYICDALRDLLSVTFWCFYKCMQIHANALFTFMLFLSVCMSYYGILTRLSNVKR